MSSNGSAEFSAGDRVFGVARAHSAYAECTVAPVADKAQPVALIPPDLSDAQAAALPTPGLTALAALDALGVTSGTIVLIIGGAGAVGGFAVQMARSRNARVIGTASSRNHAAVESLGAQEVIDYDRVDTVSAVKAAHPSGIDAVLDLASPSDAIERTASVLRPGGRIASTIRAVDEGRIADRGLRGMNIAMARAPQSSPEGLGQLASLVISRTISVRVQAEMVGDLLTQLLSLLFPRVRDLDDLEGLPNPRSAIHIAACIRSRGAIRRSPSYFRSAWSTAAKNLTKLSPSPTAFLARRANPGGRPPGFRRGS